MRGRIVINLKEKNDSTLVACEAELLGIRYKIIEELSGYFGDASTIFFDDLSVLENVKSDGCRLVYISSDSVFDIQGVDVCLNKPLIIEEIRNLLLESFSEYKNTESTSNKSRDLFISDRVGRCVEVFGEEIKLSENEMIIFERLYEMAGTVVERAELSRLIGSDNDSNITDVYICHLRGKLEAITKQKIIRTVRGKGYLLDINF